MPKVSMNLIFVLVPLMAVIFSVIAGVVLYDFAKDIVTETVYEAGRSQISAAAGRIEGDIVQMRKSARQAELMVHYYAQRGADLTNPTTMVTTLNESLYNSWVPLILDKDEINTFSLTVLYRGLQQVQSILVYYDLLRDGSREYVWSWTNTSNGLQNLAYLLNPTTMRIEDFLYDIYFYDVFAAYPTWDPAGGPTEAWTSVRPWIAGDGNVYFYFGLTYTFGFNGMEVITEPFQVLVAWLDKLKASMEANAQAMILDSEQRIVASTIASVDDRVRCEFPESNNTTPAECLAAPASSHPDKLTRTVVNHFWQPSWALTRVPSISTQQSRLRVDGKEYFAVAEQLFNQGDLRLYVLWVKSADGTFDVLASRVSGTIAVTCVCILLSLTMLAVITYAMVLRPMRDVTVQMDHVTKMDLEKLDSANLDSAISEVHQFQSKFKEMSNAMLSFTRYVPKDVVRDLLDSGMGVASLGMMNTEATVMFIDIANFTSLCESVEGTDMLNVLLTRYFDAATRTLMQHHGTIDKFIGDAIMVMWGVPCSVMTPEYHAIMAGLHLLGVVDRELGKEFESHGLALGVRVGCHSGPCLAGNIGARDRMSYTVLGDTVNTAARLEGLNKVYKSRFMVSGITAGGTDCGTGFVFRMLGSVRVKGKADSLPVAEVVGMAPHNEDENLISARSSQHRAMSRRSSHSRQSSGQTSSARKVKRFRDGELTHAEQVEAVRSYGMVATKNEALAAVAYTEGVTAYETMRFAEAIERFDEVAQMMKDRRVRPGFAPDVEARLARCHELLRAKPSPDDFDPTYIATSK